MTLSRSPLCILWLLAGLCVQGTLRALPARADEPAPRRLRVLCYNIHHGEGLDGKVDLPRLADVIRRTEPDLVALQEVDDRTQRTGHVNQIEVLAELTRLHGRFAKQLDYEGGGYGQAILSRFPLSEIEVRWLPGMPARERRIVASVTVEANGAALTFASTHLHHANTAIREQQADALNRLFAGEDRPVVLAGDLNATPDSKPITILRQHWQSATAEMDEMLTFPAGKPERQLDYVLFRPRGRFHVHSVHVIEEPVASDHRPLLVEFRY